MVYKVPINHNLQKHSTKDKVLINIYTYIKPKPNI